MQSYSASFEIDDSIFLRICVIPYLYAFVTEIFLCIRDSAFVSICVYYLLKTEAAGRLRGERLGGKSGG